MFSRSSPLVTRSAMVCRLSLYLLLSLALASCAAGKVVSSPGDLVDDGKRNTLLMSYEIRLDANDRYPGVSGTRLALRCQDTDRPGRHSVCFNIDVPFTGLRQHEDYVYHSFERSGTRLYQVKYGRYTLSRATYSILVGQRRRRVCYPHTSKDFHRHSYPYQCYNEYTDINSDYLAALAEPAYFRVDAGEGCYLGHLTLHLRGNRVVEYSLDTALSAIDLEGLPEPLRGAVPQQITHSCNSDGKPLNVAG